MLRRFATAWSKLAYIFKMEREGGLNEALGKVQQAKGAAERKQAADKKAQADAREARIKEMAEMEERGFYSCENGHESSIGDLKGATEWVCSICGKPAKFVKRSEMTGQEQYESDKGRIRAWTCS